MDNIIDVCGYIFIACMLCSLITVTTEIIVASLKEKEYVKHTDKKNVESHKIISLHKDHNDKGIYLYKNQKYYFFYSETDEGYCFDKQNVSDCYIKIVSPNEVPHIEIVTEYTEIEVVKKIPIFLRFNTMLDIGEGNIGDKSNVDEKTHYVIYVPQDSYIKWYSE